MILTAWKDIWKGLCFRVMTSDLLTFLRVFFRCSLIQSDNFVCCEIGANILLSIAGHGDSYHGSDICSFVEWDNRVENGLLRKHIMNLLFQGKWYLLFPLIFYNFNHIFGLSINKQSKPGQDIVLWSQLFTLMIENVWKWGIALCPVLWLKYLL